MADGPKDILERSDVQRARRVARERWHYVTLLFVMIMMVWFRIRSLGNFLTSDGIVFSGNDAWYHYRQVKYTVQNWPFTMPFDPGTGFPTGTFQGQFGTLYDQIIATVALIVGFGSPSDATIRLVLLLAPVVFGALVAIPTYYIGRELMDSRGGGLIAAGVLALIPGTFFRRTMVGAADHNAAEPLFLLLMLSALLYMLKVVAEDEPVFEMLIDPDELRESLRDSMIAVGLFVVATVAFVLVWPPAVAFIGVIGVGTVLYAAFTADVDNPLVLERTMIGLGVGFIGVAIVILPFIDSFGFVPTIISIPHVFVPFGVGVFALVFAGYERIRASRGYPVWIAPVAIAAISVLGAVAARVLVPGVFSLLSSLLINNFGLNIGQSTATIGEAQSVFTVGTGIIYSQYGLLFGPFILGVLAALYNGIRDRKPERFLLGFVGFAVMLMAFSQIRYNYYLAAFVALFSVRVLVWIASLLSIPEDIPELGGYQIITILIIGSLLLPSILFPFAGTVFAQRTAPGAYTKWDETLDWMDENTPEQGQLGAPQNEPLDHYGTYDRPSDGDFDYPNGSYGVMSWWDYGHWITASAERTPVANPFQQHATPAAKFLLADSEEEAQEVVEEDLGSEGQVRYVVIDWKTVVGSSPNGKFGALPSFHPNASARDYITPVFIEAGNRLVPATYLRTQAYYETMAVRLYYYHGTRIPESNYAVQWEDRAVRTSDGGRTTVPVLDRRQPTIFFNNSTLTDQYARNNTNTRDGGLGILAPEPVPALEHYRLVHASNSSATENRAYRVSVNRYARSSNLPPSSFNPYDSWVKVFERVPGATIQGEGPPNSTVTASVVMEMSNGAQFRYTQQAQTGPDGEFTMTVPYSTTGYDNWGPEQGYTDPSVTAASDYQFTVTKGSGNQTTTWTASTDVTEAKVIGEDDSPVTVTLTESNDSNESSTSEDGQNSS